MKGLCSGVWPERICRPQCLLCAGSCCAPCPAPGFLPELAPAYYGEQRSEYLLPVNFASLDAHLSSCTHPCVM